MNYTRLINVISGKPESFTCVATNSTPAARYHWYKGATNITSADDGGVKLVTFNKLDNGSKLKCRGWNYVTKMPFPESSLVIDVLCKCHMIIYTTYTKTSFDDLKVSMVRMGNNSLMRRWFLKWLAANHLVFFIRKLAIYNQNDEIK